LLALAVVILAISAANAGGVLLGRAEARVKEIAVRMAVGATQARLLKDSICEAGLLVLAGASLGIPMAWAATEWMTRVVTLPTDFPFAIAPRIDARIVLVAAVASAIAAMVCGCAPALAARGVDISAVLKGAGANGGGLSMPALTRRGWNRHRWTWRNGLVAMEVALASTLAATGASLFESVKAVNRIDPGYRVEHVLTLALDPTQTGYTRERTRVFYEQLLGRVRSLAGVKSAALAQSVVLGYTRTPAQVSMDCSMDSDAENAAPARGSTTMWMNTVTPEYFALMRLPLIAGRAFDDGDTETSPAVAIINQELAKRVVESAGIGKETGGAIGAPIRVNGRMVRVVGIAHSAKYFEIHEVPQPYLYLPHSQNYASRMVLHIETATRAAGDSHAVLTAVLYEIHAMDATQPVSEIRPLRDYLDRGAMLDARVGVDAIGVVGASALALALAGIWGLMGHVAAQKQREIGIRMALGATRRSVIGMVMRQAIAIVAIGAAGGLAAAFATRLLAAMAAGTGGMGAWSDGGAAVVAMAGLAAALVPAWRASTIDPIQALRHE
jgi:predicted permease